MPNTLTLTATVPVVVTLHDDMEWPDEFDWAAASTRRGYSVGGALLLDAGTKLAGRPITLRGNPSGRAPITRADALTLRGWTDDPAAVMTLLFRGVTYSVGFAAVESPLTVEHQIDYSDPLGTDLVFVTLRLITLA